MARKKRGAAAKQPPPKSSPKTADATASVRVVENPSKTSEPIHDTPSPTSANSDLKLEFFPEQLLRDDCGDAKEEQGTIRPLVGAIDQGTSSTRFVLFNVQGKIVASAQMEHPQLYPQTGWHEHNPVTLWQNTVTCLQAVRQVVEALDHKKSTATMELNATTLKAIGITNQRETVLAWNRITGQPYYNAIVWDDTRTASYAQALETTASSKLLTPITGLPISSYFAGTKVKWLLDHVAALANDVQERPQEVCFGTVDTWLLWQLTGQQQQCGDVNTGGCFYTDVTNASRWLFMDLKTCQWHEDCVATVVAPHVLPMECLPTICPSSHMFGHVSEQCSDQLGPWAAGIPVAAVLGDQQAALFGQTAFTAGRAKNTYGTGLFLMMNTGPNICTSRHGLLTTVAYQIGTEGAVHYALEGSVSHSGSTIQWLRDQLQIIQTASESETLARTVDSSEGVYLVPAFAGLLAPHWRSDARGCWVGLQMSHNRAHLCRAVLEAAAYQTKEVFDAMLQDTAELGLLTENDGLSKLSVDGGGTHNELLMQFQADILDVPVVQPQVMETTSLGAAFAAGLAVGVWQSLAELEQLWAVGRVYQPNMTETERATRVRGWNKAVSKSLGWVGYGDDEDYQSHLDAFQPVARPMSTRSVVSSSKSSANHINGNGISAMPLHRVVESATVGESVEAPVVINATAKDPSATTQEEEETQVAPSKDLPTDDLPSEPKKYSATALGWTTVAALGVGLLLGGSRRR